MPEQTQIELAVFADYFQFYLHDEVENEDFGALWSDEAVESVLRPYFGGTRMTVGFERALSDGVVAPIRHVMAPVAMSEEERSESGQLSQPISN